MQSRPWLVTHRQENDRVYYSNVVPGLYIKRNCTGECEMAIDLIIDDRTSSSQSIRNRIDRRANQASFLLLRRPFKDSNGRWVSTDRRSGKDRRAEYKW